MKFLFKTFSTWISITLSLVVILGGLIVFFLFFYSSDLPDYMQLSKYDPPITTRIYASDGRLMEEYAKEKRIFVPIKDIPKRVIDAFLAAEDRNFYTHSGVDPFSILRAATQNLLNIGRKKNMIGGSTITQQVAKNFLLTNERSLERKIKEAILAIRISTAFTKDKILELYLNEIFLGRNSYGVAAAALNYFNKSIDELTIEETAFLAALPKAPSGFDPDKNYERALSRRNWVIDGMREVGYIKKDEAENAKKKPIALNRRDSDLIAPANYFAEEVRRDLVKTYGKKVLYEDGLFVKTSMVPGMQQLAEKSLKAGLEDYDKRRGYRGPVGKISLEKDFPNNLEKFKKPKAAERDWDAAAVTSVTSETAEILTQKGEIGTLVKKGYEWTGQKKLSNILSKGDVILVRKQTNTESDYALQQVPEVSGAIVAMDPHTGRVLAMYGGYSYEDTQFNRVTQAKRQPGSAFKPFVYLAAMENGYTPSTIVDDAPIELDQGPGLPKWSPQNYSDKFYGPSTLRIGLEHSRNIMTVRLSLMLGLKKAVEVAKRFGINQAPAPVFSTVLGSIETNLLDLTNAYCILVNGGKRVTPNYIEKIQDRTGKTIYKGDTTKCDGCSVKSVLQLAIVSPPLIADTREQVTDERSAFQVVSMLQGVVERGTGTRAKEIGKVIAGKTGTTNDSKDAWFIGFTPDLVVGVFVGYDKPESLGDKETGGSVAVPIFTNFMKEALKNTPSIPFRVPEGITQVRVDHRTGRAPTPEAPESQIIYEAFKADNLDGSKAYINTNQQVIDPNLPRSMQQNYNQNSGAENQPEPTTSDEIYTTPIAPSEESTPTIGTGGIY